MGEREKNGAKGCGTRSGAATREERNRERAKKQRARKRKREEGKRDRGAAAAWWMEDSRGTRGGERARSEPEAGVETIGWVVCCGLLRLGRDSSAPATGGGFSRVPTRRTSAREPTPFACQRGEERDGKKRRTGWGKGKERRLCERTAERAHPISIARP